WFAGADDTPGGVRQGITVFAGFVLQTNVKTYLTWFRYYCLVQQCQVGLCRLVESPMLTGVRFTRTLRQLDCQPRTPPSRTTGVDPDARAAEGNAAGVEFEEGAAAFGGQLHAGVDHHFVPGVVVDFLSGFDELALTEFDVLVVGDSQMIIRLDFRPA